MTALTERYDVLIIGGGMVGASLARAMAGRGIEVGVVEASVFSANTQPSYDDRAIALAWSSRMVLDAIGAWSGLAALAEPIKQIHISDRGRFGFARLDHREEGVEALGYVVTARELGRSLLDGLDRLVHWICPARLEAFTVGEDAVTVDLALDSGSRRVQARLLVAADGGRSAVRDVLEIPVREWSYDQSALISNIDPGVPHGGTAYERFTDTGPLAMLPMTGGRCSLVWTVRDADLHELLSLDDTTFLERLQERFGYRLGRLRRAGVRAAYPLKQVIARESVRPRVALIGNAAHSVHPVAGQGFNLGIRDAAALAEILVEGARSGTDPGSMETLERYTRWRRRDQRGVALLTDGLVRVFTNPLAPFRFARSLGLLGLDLAPPLKHLACRRFMGLGAGLPRLVRGLALD